MSDTNDFRKERLSAIRAMRTREDLSQRADGLFLELVRSRYTYNFDWLGLPIIQMPQDILAAQELIWRVRPGAIIETGVARGGSVIFSASMLQLLNGDGIVVGIDIEIRPHNREAIEKHPLAGRVRLVEGSSTDPLVQDRVRKLVGERRPVMVFLDSNHTHSHVLAELRAYSSFVGRDSYIIVYDSVIDRLPAGESADRPWGPGDNPRTAVHAFLAENDRFEIDRDTEGKLVLTCCPDGFLRCLRDP
jgi:cephalosporin hydroxylase